VFSALFCLVLREKVDMDRAGRVGGAEALVWGEPLLSGDRDKARVAEGVLWWEDDVLLVLPLELRERCSWEPMSPMVDEMLWREACLRRGGVVRTRDGNWNS
jgi:hypothetical protein